MGQTLELKLPRERKLDLSRPRIMGIVNVTPDSFSDGGKFFDKEKAIEHAFQLISEGADIVDIGGESSRPGSEPISEEEEERRVIPVIEAVRKESDIAISIDTTKSEIARKAISAGADMINDISALKLDDQMVGVAFMYEIPVILMHMKGTPKTMQDQPEYADCIDEIMEFFRERTFYCRDNGIAADKIMIDPGIGFGKRLEDNIEILRTLDEFVETGYPVVLGASRKSFITKITGQRTRADKRIGGSLGAALIGLQKGCQIFRVHDVAETIEAFEVFRAVAGDTE